MTPRELGTRIARLPAHPPATVALEAALARRGVKLRRPWYSASQRQHWLGWLAEYQGPGAYRRTGFDHDAAFAYNHCGCPPMVLWLAEASGVDTARVGRAARVALSAGPHLTTRCAAMRRIIPWSLIEAQLSRGRR